MFQIKTRQLDIQNPDVIQWLFNPYIYVMNGIQISRINSGY